MLGLHAPCRQVLGALEDELNSRAQSPMEMVGSDAVTSAEPPPDTCDDPIVLCQFYHNRMCKSVKRRAAVANWSPSKTAAMEAAIKARLAAAAKKDEPPPAVPEATSMLLLLGQYGVKVAASLSFFHAHMLSTVVNYLGNVVTRADPTTPIFSLAGAAVGALLCICALSCLLAALLPERDHDVLAMQHRRQRRRWRGVGRRREKEGHGQHGPR